MAVYVLHIEPPYRHARHYIGFTRGAVLDRYAVHMEGRGSPLIRAAVAAGHSVTVAHAWSCGNRRFERHLKNRKDANRWCKLCAEKRRPRPTFAAFCRKVAGFG